MNEKTSPGEPGNKPGSDSRKLLERYLSIRRFTLRLCEPLAVEDYVPQSMTEASPAKWHLAHTSWFFEQFILGPHAPGYEVFHPQYAFLFNSYYNAVGKRVARPARGLMTRPTLGEVLRYRKSVDEAMAALIGDTVGGPERQRLLYLLELGLNHELQHQELLLTDLKHLLSLNPMKPEYLAQPDREPGSMDPGPPAWVRFEEGVYGIGHEGNGFAFDNEGPRHRCFLESFSIADRLVTNGEYLQFMADGGYERPELWLDEGWTAARDQKWRAPLYWSAGGEGGSDTGSGYEAEDWRTFSLAGEKPLGPHEPVCHVGYYEADAFARWADARLPDEAEWETACGGQEQRGNFVEEGLFHPACCTPSAAGPLRQAFGDVWEWTRSPYHAYPRYRPESGAVGEYNGKFMCNQFVLRGGSCATSRIHIRASYRNFFHPDKRWQFTGIRLARDGQ